VLGSTRFIYFPNDNWFLMVDGLGCLSRNQKSICVFSVPDLKGDDDNGLAQNLISEIVV